MGTPSQGDVGRASTASRLQTKPAFAARSTVTGLAFARGTTRPNTSAASASDKPVVNANPPRSAGTPAVLDQMVDGHRGDREGSHDDADASLS